MQAALRDPALVERDGTPIAPRPDGSLERLSRTHVDGRGTVTEIYDTRWNFHPAPVKFIYTYTIQPGRAKGWGLHEKHEDRYFLLEGRMEIVCYDVRPDSPTAGQITKIVLSEENPRLVTIPTYVWHANVNIGSGDVRVINLPTLPYDHENPDKLRLPLNTDLIPYKIEGCIGW